MLTLPNDIQDCAAVVIFGQQVSQYERLLVHHSFCTSTLRSKNQVLNESGRTNGTSSAVVANKDAVVPECKSEVPVRYNYHDTIDLDAYHAGCIKSILTESKQFCKGFLEYVKRKCIHTHEPEGNRQNFALNEHVTSVYRLVTVNLVSTNKEWIDYKW